MKSKTTKELVGELIHIEQQLEYAENVQEHEELEVQQKQLQAEVKNKIENVDYFMIELNKKEHLIDAEVKGKRKGLERTLNYFNKQLLPAVILEIGNDEGVYETNTARYKLYETFGPVNIDPHMLSDDFKKVEIVEKLDKVKARKAAISAFNAGEDMPPGIDITKVKRVKRT